MMETESSGKIISFTRMETKNMYGLFLEGLEASWMSHYESLMSSSNQAL